MLSVITLVIVGVLATGSTAFLIAVAVSGINGELVTAVLNAIFAIGTATAAILLGRAVIEYEQDKND